MTDGPLSHVSVLECSTMIAGPYAGQLLGDLGADVVKVERPGTGELARGLEPTVNGESFYYLTANRNKRSVALDLTTDEGLDVFMDLAASADVVLENFPPDFTERYGIDYDAVVDRNEDVVYCAISAYGDTGPRRTQPGIDTTIQALSGAMSMTRSEDTPPMRSGVPMNDVFASLYAVQGIVTALYNRERTGEGEFIDVSMLDAGVAGLTTRAMYSLVTRDVYPPFGRQHNYFAPEGVFPAADGDVQLSVVTDRHWWRLCDVLSDPDLAADERFDTVADRVSNRGMLAAELRDRFVDWTVVSLVDALREAGVPAAPINDTVSVWDDPQVQAREMHRTLSHPTAGTIDAIGFPVKYRNIDQMIDRHPPLLGEHTDEVLSEAGYSEAERRSLIGSGAVEVADGAPSDSELATDE